MECQLKNQVIKKLKKSLKLISVSPQIVEITHLNSNYISN